MKLAAIYNIFDGYELLEKSIEQIRDHVDYVIGVWQDVSNYGQEDGKVGEVVQELLEMGMIDRLLYFLPDRRRNYSPVQMETMKRQWGMNVAKDEGCTHFLSMDVDEFYISEEFEKAKKEVESSGFGGSACRIKVYYKSPTLSFEKLDDTWVPFIHKLYHTVKTGVSKYPVYADPTRKASFFGRFKQFGEHELLMHHLSWVRLDIGKKVHNSTARPNLKRHGANLLDEYNQAKEGSHIKCLYNDVLQKVDNIFQIEL